MALEVGHRSSRRIRPGRRVAEPGRVARLLRRRPDAAERGGGRRSEPEDRRPPRILQGPQPHSEAVFGRRRDQFGRQQDPEGAA